MDFIIVNGGLSGAIGKWIRFRNRETETSEGSVALAQVLARYMCEAAIHM